MILIVNSFLLFFICIYKTEDVCVCVLFMHVQISGSISMNVYTLISNLAIYVKIYYSISRPAGFGRRIDKDEGGYDFLQKVRQSYTGTKSLQGWADILCT